MWCGSHPQVARNFEYLNEYISNVCQILQGSRGSIDDSNGTEIRRKKRGEKMAIFSILPAFTRGLTPLRSVSHLASRVRWHGHARPVKFQNLTGPPKARRELHEMGTGTPSRVTGVPGRANFVGGLGVPPGRGPPRSITEALPSAHLVVSSYTSYQILTTTSTGTLHAMLHGLNSPLQRRHCRIVALKS